MLHPVVTSVWSLGPVATLAFRSRDLEAGMAALAVIVVTVVGSVFLLGLALVLYLMRRYHEEEHSDWPILSPLSRVVAWGVPFLQTLWFWSSYQAASAKNQSGQGEALVFWGVGTAILLGLAYLVHRVARPRG